MSDYSGTDFFYGTHGDFSLVNGDFRTTTSPLRAIWQIIRTRLAAEREDWPLEPGWMKASLSDFVGEPLGSTTFRSMEIRSKQTLTVDRLLLGSDVKFGSVAIDPDTGVMKMSLNVSGTPGAEDTLDFTYIWDTREKTIGPFEK